MPVLQGSLIDVTAEPSTASEVWVRAPRGRVSGTRVVVPETRRVEVTGGEFSVNVEPGPAYLVVVHATSPQEHVPLLVQEGMTTIAEAVRLGDESWADFSPSQADAIRAEVVASVAKARQQAEDAATSATAADKSAAAAGTDAREVASAREVVEGYRAEVVSLHGEAVDARDVAVGVAETATTQAETATDRAGAAAESAAAAGESETRAAASAQYASDAADRVGTAEQVGTWAQQAQDAADRIGTAEQVEGWADDARDSASSASLSESKAKGYRDAAATAASSAVDDARSELGNIVSDAADYATDASRSAARAWTSESNAATHESNSLAAAKRAEFAAEETVQQVEGDFATRNYVDSSKWNQGPLTAAQVGTLDNAPDGFSAVGSVNQARELEAPFEAAQVIGTFRFSGVAYQIGIARVDLKMRLVGRFYSASGWREWQEFEGLSQPPTHIETEKRAAPGSGFKTVPVAVTMGNSGTTHLAATGSYRFPLLNNAPITRWRLCVTTRRPRQGDLSGADVTLTKVAYGDHASNGAFSDAPTVVAENIHVPSDGTTVKLPWVSGEFGAGVERLISISYTSNNDIGPLSLHGYCFDMGTADAADQAATGTASGSGPLDMWLEAETYSTTPVIAAIGDSTTASSGAARTTYDGWLNVYCREKSALPVHYASAGDTALNWMSNPEGYKATRWLDLDAPDSIIYNLGNNDVGGGANLQTIQQRVAAMMPILEKITPNIYAATLKPRTGQDPAQVQVRQSYNQWLLQESDFFRDVFDFSAATVDVDGESIRPEFNSGDDTHLNTAGYVALAGAITRPVTAPPVVYQSI